MTEFTGKSVIVSGSSSGIGEGIAILLASQGANVTVCGRDVSRLQDVAEKCRKAAQDAGHNAEVIAVSGDMTSADVRAETVQKTVEAFGAIDVLVANHGIGVSVQDILSTTEQQFDSQIDHSVKSKYFLIKEAVPHLEKTKGCVVVTSSVGSTLISGVNLPYFMSMAALDHMVRGLALQLGPKGIRVNAINPTAVATRIFRDLETSPIEGHMGESIAKSHPLYGRMGTVEEQAKAVAFLASDAASFITGECLKVDGGITTKGLVGNFYTPPAEVV